MIDITRGALNGFKKVNNSFVSTKLFHMPLRQRAVEILIFSVLMNHKISLTVALLWGLRVVPLDCLPPRDTEGGGGPCLFW